MTEKEHIEKAHKLATEWFANHVAKTTATGDYFNLAFDNGLKILWRKPENWNYIVWYYITGGYVVALGDLGDAVYAFTQPVTLNFLSTCDWHYFVNKCTASETGRSYTMKVPGIKSPVPHVRAIGHFVGLQMAIKQLRSNSTVQP